MGRPENNYSHSYFNVKDAALWVRNAYIHWLDGYIPSPRQNPPQIEPERFPSEEEIQQYAARFLETTKQVLEDPRLETYSTLSIRVEEHPLFLKMAADNIGHILLGQSFLPENKDEKKLPKRYDANKIRAGVLLPIDDVMKLSPRQQALRKATHTIAHAMFFMPGSDGTESFSLDTSNDFLVPIEKPQYSLVLISDVYDRISRGVILAAEQIPQS